MTNSKPSFSPRGNMSFAHYAILVNHKELEDIIKQCYQVKQPLMIWGAPGIGKSYTVRKIAKEIAREMNREFVEWNKIRDKYMIIRNPSKYFVLIDIRLSQYDPSDLKGLPKSVDGGIEWKPPMWLYAMSLPGSAGIIFLDELPNAPRSVQFAAYQLVLDRAVGEVTLADDVYVIAAGNRLEDAPIEEMPRPLQNRFTHVELKVPDVDEWIEWASENNIDIRIMSFLKVRPSLLYKPPKEDVMEKAWPTPRSWEFASRLINGIPDEKEDLIYKLVASAVGTGVATEFIGFLRLRMKIKNVDDILEGRVEPPMEPDQIVAMISIVVEKARKDVNIVEKYAKNVSKKISDEYNALFLKLLKSTLGVKTLYSLMSNKHVAELVRRIGRYLM